MSDKELKEEVMNELIRRGLSFRKTARLFKVSYATFHRALRQEKDLSTMMRLRMQKFVEGVI